MTPVALRKSVSPSPALILSSDLYIGVVGHRTMLRTAPSCEAYLVPVGLLKRTKPMVTVTRFPPLLMPGSVATSGVTVCRYVAARIEFDS